MKKLKEQRFLKESRPVVSISCISYNQENYIGNVIEGFLNQIVDFPVEILIHDDASTDRTASIIEEYGREYPNIIKPILQSQNKFSRGVKCIHATFNFTRSKGKYIATCEGDDYWIDEKKLYKQVAFLEKNKDFVLCSHEVYFSSINYKKNLRSLASIFYRNARLSGATSFFSLCKELISDNKSFWQRRRSGAKRYYEADFKKITSTHYKNIYIPTVSILANGDILRELPEYLQDTPSGHREHILWCALHGKLKHLKDVMGQRNQQENSLTVTNLHKGKGFDKHKDYIMFYKKLQSYADTEQKKIIDQSIKEMDEYFK